MRRDWTEQLTAYVDGELSELEAKALEAELARDPALRALEQRLRRTVALVEALPAPEPSTALRRAVLSRIDQPTLGERLKGLFTPPRLGVAGLAAAAVAAVVVVAAQPKDVPGDEEQLFLAQNMEVIEDLDLVGLDSPDDLDVVASLHELEVQR